MYLKTMKRILALAAAALLAFGAEAKNYTTVWSQDFEDGMTYTNELWTGAVESALLGSAYIAPAALPDGYTVYNESYELSSKDDKKISPELRTEYDTQLSSRYLRVVRYGNNTANFIFQMPASVASVTDYKIEIDYFLGISFANALKTGQPNYAGTNGLAICMSSGNILATFAGLPNTSKGMLFKGDTTELLCSSFPTEGRGSYDSANGYWLHVVIRGSADEGVVMSVKNEAGTTILAETQLSATFDTVDKFYMKAGAYQYRHCISLDDVVVSEAVEAKTYVWTGAEDNRWANTNNWTVGGKVTEYYPSSSDTAVVNIADQTIVVEPGQTFGPLTLDATTKFKVAFMENGQTFTVPTGITAERVITYPPFAMALEGSTYTVTRNAATFTWSATDGSWNTVANWRIGGEETLVLPIKTDSVLFPAGAAYNVTIESAQEIATLTAAGNVAFSGAVVYLAMANGEGVITLGDNAGLHAYNTKEYATTLVVSNDLVITASADKAAYLSGHWVSSSGTGSLVDIYGDVSGSGHVNVRGCRSTVNLHGDWSDFSGTAIFWDDASKAGATRWKLYFDEDFHGSSNAMFTVEAINNNMLSDDRNVFFGALNGNPKSGSYAGTLEIGGIDKDSAITGGTLYNHTIRKVGTGTMAISGCGVKNYEIANGVLSVGSSDSLPWNALAFAGGTLKVGYEEVEVEEGVTNKVPFDVSAKIKNSTKAIAYDDQGLDTAWATVIDASNAGGLTKKGAGTLSLARGTALNGALRVEAGKMGVVGGFTGEEGTLLSWQKDASAREITLDDFAEKPVSPVSVAIVTNDTTISLVLSRKSNTYVYVGPDLGNWSDANNWQMGGEAATVAPSSGDAVSIDGGNRVIVEPGQSVGEVALEDGAKLAVRVTEDGQVFTQLTTVTTPLTTDDVVALGPFAFTLKDGVFTAKRVPSVFVWVGADGDWAEIANWKVNGLPTTVLPGTNDTAEFPKALTSVAVAVTEADRFVSNVVANANLVLSGANYLRANLIYGSGLIVLNGAKVMCNTANLDISNDVSVATGTDNELRVSSNKESTFYRINLHGKLSGSGNITANHGGRQNAGVAFFNDNHEFSGTFETTNFNQRDATYMDSYIASSSNAIWKVGVLSNNSTKDIFPSTDDAYKYFGAYVGNTWVSHGAKLEIGHCDDVESTLYAYSHINYEGSVIRKVGANALNLKYGTSGTAVTKVDALYMEDGTVCLDYDLVPKAVTFEQGGVLAFSGDVSDLSANIVDSAAAIAIDDGGTNATWATAIAASNVGGFTKKGAGTLTLTAVPEYTGLTTVEDGKMVVPNGTVVTINAASVGLFEGGTVTQAIFTEGTVTTNVVADSSEADIRSYACPIDYSKVTVDLSEKTDWDEGATYYVVTPAGIVAGTGIERDGCKLILPEEQQSKWTLGTVNLAGSGKVLALVSRAGLIITIR